MKGTVKQSKFLIGGFESLAGGKPQLSVFNWGVAGVKTKFEPEDHGPAPHPGEIWIFEPLEVTASSGCSRTMTVKLIHVISKRPEITLDLKPAPKFPGKWEATEKQGSYTIKYVPANDSLFKPETYGGGRFAGTISFLVDFNPTRNFAIVAVHLNDRPRRSKKHEIEPWMERTRRKNGYCHHDRRCKRAQKRKRESYTWRK